MAYSVIAVESIKKPSKKKAIDTNAMLVVMLRVAA
jgi:hypothetical protein